MITTPQAVVGSSEQHLAEVAPGGPLLHRDVVEPFRVLQQRASENGHQLMIASGFRAFDRQLAIWNAKATGQRPILDSNGAVLNPAELTPKETVFAILRWSALPGGSRHHWGTDMDVWDPSVVPADYQLQLVPEEYQDSGPFAGLSDWLDTQLTDSGFQRPYIADSGGVAPERWHLSYRPVASDFEAVICADLLAEQLANTELALKETVLEHLDEIYQRFVQVNWAE